MDKATSIEIPQELPNQSANPTPESQGMVLKEKDKSISVNPQNSKGFIRHKWAYVKFKRAIQKGSYVSAKITAKVLGVNPRTLQEWSNKPEIQRLLNENIDKHIKVINKSKDWKAHAYLIDKIDATEDKENNSVDLKQMIVINT